MKSIYLLTTVLFIMGCATEGGKYQRDIRTAKDTLEKYEKDTVDKLKSKRSSIKKVKLPTIDRNMCLEQAMKEAEVWK